MSGIEVYNREKALEYAHKWAYGRNPAFYDFSQLGGDCADFASQVLYAGTGVLNYTPVTGWFYMDANHRTAAWTGVPYFYDFMVSNQGPGPFGEAGGLDRVEPGDFIQFTADGRRYTHTLVVISAGNPAAPHNVRIAAHSSDADGRLLSSYAIQEMRCIHILGYRKN